MRVPSKIAGTILKTLGATGVKVPAPGTSEALNKGVIDGHLSHTQQLVHLDYLMLLNIIQKLTLLMLLLD